MAESSFEMKGEWGGLRAVGMVRSERVVDGVAWSEKRYYICSRVMSAKSFASAARGLKTVCIGCWTWRSGKTIAECARIMRRKICQLCDGSG